MTGKRAQHCIVFGCRHAATRKSPMCTKHWWDLPEAERNSIKQADGATRARLILSAAKWLDGRPGAGRLRRQVTRGARWIAAERSV